MEMRTLALALTRSLAKNGHHTRMAPQLRIVLYPPKRASRWIPWFLSRSIRNRCRLTCAVPHAKWKYGRSMPSSRGWFGTGSSAAAVTTAH